MDNEYWFTIRDPLPVNEGDTYLISYEKLVNGRNPQIDESSDLGVWDYSIVISTSYADDTIPYYFD